METPPTTPDSTSDLTPDATPKATPDAPNTLTLVGAAPTMMPPSQDRGGGEKQGGPRDWFGRAAQSVIDIDIERAREGLARAIGQVSVLLAKEQHLVGTLQKDWTLDTFTVALAITGEGSVGVATVGAEASFQLTFARRERTAAASSHDGTQGAPPGVTR